MRTPTKYVKELVEEEKEKLREIVIHGETDKERRRAKSILLSNKKYSIDEIAEIIEKDRDTISELIDKWEENRFEALIDKARSGRPRKLNKEEQEEVKKK